MHCVNDKIRRKVTLGLFVTLLADVCLSAVPSSYHGHGKRSPFVPLASIKKQTHAQPKKIQNYSLAAMRMVGSLQEDKKIWGIVMTPDKKIYHVELGDYIGRESAQVTEVNSQDITVSETIADGSGGWLKRQLEIKRITQNMRADK